MLALADGFVAPAAVATPPPQNSASCVRLATLQVAETVHIARSSSAYPGAREQPREQLLYLKSPLKSLLLLCTVAAVFEPTFHSHHPRGLKLAVYVLQSIVAVSQSTFTPAPEACWAS
jgi:hypothetical protein